MLQFLFFLVFLSKASKGDDKSKKIIDDTALVVSVKKTLDECAEIVGTVGDFLSVHVIKDAIRRRLKKDGNLSGEVKKKLKTCGELVNSVNDFSHGTLSSLECGLIRLQYLEASFLRNALRGVSKKMSEVLYVASKDGAGSAASFHKACDGKGDTVVIVESTTGAVFGGYTDLNWNHAGNYAKSLKTFIFQLRPVQRIYKIKSGREGYAIYKHSGYGPTFGGGHDLHIASSPFGNTNSYTNGGHSYDFPSYPNYQLTDGTKHFKVKDYAVFLAISL